jgi:hypothetical protein
MNTKTKQIRIAVSPASLMSELTRVLASHSIEWCQDKFQTHLGQAIVGGGPINVAIGLTINEGTEVRRLLLNFIRDHDAAATAHTSEKNIDLSELFSGEDNQMLDTVRTITILGSA